jgi:hypothetical protein
MKKSILIICATLTSVSLMAYGFINWTPTKGECSTVYDEATKAENGKYSDFFYGIGPRFQPILKGDLQKYKSMYDFITEDEASQVKKFDNVSVIIILNERQSDIRAHGSTAELTNEQKQLIQSSDYSARFTVRGDYYGKDPYTGKMSDLHFGPHYTVVPKKQAQYMPGDSSLIDYFTVGNKENTLNLDEKKLRPAKLYFTITKTGNIANIRLDNHSGYHKIDDAMKNLLLQLPGKWQPAENEKGEKVAQELVISFGMVGC